jgi:kynurenine formamidase
MARAVLEMRFLNQPAGATVQSITNDNLRKEFVVVKHSDERVQKLIQRGYTEKEKSQSKAATTKASASELIFHSTMWEKRRGAKE